MRPFPSRSFLLAAALALVACNPPVPPEMEGEGTPGRKERKERPKPAAPKKGEEKKAPASFAGYYQGTLPCADCPGIRTRLWVRADSTFILAQQYLDRDSIPFAQFGSWYVVDGLLAVGTGTDKPEFWKPKAKGLVNVDEAGEEWQVGPKMQLDKQGATPVPVMHVTGAYVFAEGAHTFTPCGSAREFPLAVSEGDVGLEKLYTKRFRKKAGRLYVELEATVGTAEAQEGDAKDEYVFPKKLVRVLDGSCP